MEKIILDTSVIAKWFKSEEGTPQAIKYLEDFKEKKILIIVPDIVALELANVLYWGAGYKEDKLKEALSSYFQLELQSVPLNQRIIQGAGEMMEKHSISIYDAIFICLAETYRIPLLTADTKHHRKKYSGKIKYLTDF